MSINPNKEKIKELINFTKLNYPNISNSELFNLINKDFKLSKPAFYGYLKELNLFNLTTDNLTTDNLTEGYDDPDNIDDTEDDVTFINKLFNTGYREDAQECSNNVEKNDELAEPLSEQYRMMTLHMKDGWSKVPIEDFIDAMKEFPKEQKEYFMNLRRTYTNKS